MTALSILSILAAIAAMAYVFSGLRRLDDSVTNLEERCRKIAAETPAPPAKEEKKR